MLKNIFYVCTFASLFSLPAFAVDDEQTIDQESVICCGKCGDKN